MNGKIKNTAAVLSGLGAGALLMFLMDPDRGRRRRAMIRDKAIGISNDMLKAVESKSHHLRNRAYGLFHEARSLTGLGSGRNNKLSA